jgi:hypothetical protein
MEETKEGHVSTWARKSFKDFHNRFKTDSASDSPKMSSHAMGPREMWGGNMDSNELKESNWYARGTDVDGARPDAAISFFDLAERSVIPSPGSRTSPFKSVIPRSPHTNPIRGLFPRLGPPRPSQGRFKSSLIRFWTVKIALWGFVAFRVRF